MILDPVNDEACLGQLTKIARELHATTLVQTVARRLGSRAAVMCWLQSLPQADDDGGESVRFIQCDVPQRVRLLPDDPNCVERSVGALMLLEVLDPKTPRALATVDRPLRHTGLVEKPGVHWQAVDLFPRRNAVRNLDWGELGKDVLQGAHSYVGKPLLSFYGLGSAADTLGEQEDKLIGRDKKKKPPEKKFTPPPNGDKPSAPAKSPASAQGGKPGGAAQLQRFVGAAGARPSQPSPERAGGEHAEKTQPRPHAGAAAVDGAAGAAQAGDRDGGDSHDEGEEEERWWWFLGR